MLVCCLAYSPALEMDTCSSETSVCFCYSFVLHLTYLATSVDFSKAGWLLFQRRQSRKFAYKIFFQLEGWGDIESTWFAGHYWAYSTRPWWPTSMENLVEQELAGETEVPRTLHQCHFVHHTNLLLAHSDFLLITCSSKERRAIF
jgi:hypothetical protein